MSREMMSLRYKGLIFKGLIFMRHPNEAAFPLATPSLLLIH